MTRYLIVLFFLTLLMVSTNHSQWRSAKIPSDIPTSHDYVTSMADHRGTVYAGTNLGLFVSSDHGLSWNFSSTFPYRGDEVSVSSNDSVLHAWVFFDSSLTNERLRSTDGGVTWGAPTVLETLIGTDSLWEQPRYFLRHNGVSYKHSLADSVPWIRAYWFDQRSDTIGYRINPRGPICNDPVRGTLLPSSDGMVYPQQVMDGWNLNFWQRDQNMTHSILSFLNGDSLYLAGSYGTVYTLKKASSVGWDSLIKAGLYPEFPFHSLINHNGTLIAARSSQNLAGTGSIFRLRPGETEWKRINFAPITPDWIETDPIRSIIVSDSLVIVGTEYSFNKIFFYCSVEQVVGFQPGIQSPDRYRLLVNEPVDSLDVRGLNFYPDSRVELDGNPLPTRFVSDGLLRFQVPDSIFRDYEDGHFVRVFTPRDGGHYSNQIPISAGYRRPELYSISPTWAYVNSSPVIRVTGKYFYRNKTRVLWDKFPVWDTVATTFISDSVLEARPSPAQMSVAQNKTIRVWNGVNSNEYKIFTILVDTSGTDVRESGNGIPEVFSLSENYPNPFNPTTSVKVGIPSTSFLRAVIYDATGREVEIIADESVSPGWYSIDWSADRYASGIYILRVTAGEFTATRRLLLLR